MKINQDTQIGNTGYTLKDLIDKMPISKLLWTNPNPTSSFGNQTITLSELANFDSYEVIYVDEPGYNTYNTTGIIPKGKATKLYRMLISSNWDLRGSRGVSSNGNNLIFGNGISSNNRSGTANNWLVPLYIIGHKTNLFN